MRHSAAGGMRLSRFFVQVRIQGPIRYGSWSGREQFTSYQDMVMGTKEAERHIDQANPMV